MKSSIESPGTRRRAALLATAKWAALPAAVLSLVPMMPDWLMVASVTILLVATVLSTPAISKMISILVAVLGAQRLGHEALPDQIKLKLLELLIRG
ncbi:hypothetical protein [Nocardia ignorata]|uniref:Uncharacterized protein n=1 Tax=Nocardia ignorata TaxID=145285 RepID=A0A4R6PAF8_NOCIG|nr:hypothetical protein [Nocardia ignorata]TDP33179.1 hypothetical protein DFR75_105417 [Nocardia ignorata]